MTELFEAIRSPTTKRKYELRMRQFLAWVYGDKKLGTPNRQGKLLSKQQEAAKDRLTRQYARKFLARARAEPEWGSGAINDFLIEIKARVGSGEEDKIQASTVGIYVKPLKLFCTMNDLVVNWTKLSRKIPKGRQAADDRPPTLEEVKKILQYPDRRIKPIVLTMISSGIRVGSWDYLRWGHVEKIEKDGQLVAAKVKVYNTKSGRWYRTFITPEAYRAVLEYLNYRQSMGETITREAPIVRDLLDTDKGGFGRPSKPNPLSSKIVKRLVELAIRSAGIRAKLEPGQRRHPFKATHGFRKYFDTAAERHMKTLHVEQLLDHDTGLKESYNRPTEVDMLNDYLRAVPELMVFETQRQTPATGEIEKLRAEVKRLSERVADSDAQLKATYAAFKGNTAVIGAYSGALQKARKVFGEKRVDELLFSVIRERDERERAGRNRQKRPVPTS